MELAYLSDNAYLNPNERIQDPNDREVTVSFGQRYRVIEHVDNQASGYQGTVYQRLDTGQVIVAHRGT